MMSPSRDRQKRQRPVISCTECHRRKQKCDRSQPCSNCIKRDKRILCIYKSLAAEPPSGTSISSVSDGSGTPSGASSAFDSIRSVSDALGYAKKGTAGTVWLLGMAGDAEGAMSINDSSAPLSEPHDSAAAARYKDLVRRLPSQALVDVLVKAFFSEVAWYCDIIDAADLTAQQLAWSRVSYAALNRGPRSLPPDIRVIPALLFQVFAQALLFLSHKQAALIWDMLPCHHMPGMTVIDLATEYSDAGSDVAAILGSKDVTLGQVQAGLLRTAFQKNTGSVVEAWHTLGAAIREGQEMGLHCMDTDVGSPTSEVRCWHDVEMRARVWLALHLWDGHMGVVLGRPTLTRLDADAWLPWFADVVQNKQRLALSPKQENGRRNLTPFGFMVCGYEAAYRYLQDMQDLQARSDVQHMQAVHDTITVNMQRIPGWATAGNTNGHGQVSSAGSGSDGGTDSDSPPWLPAARETLATEIHFVLLALHRPWIFSRPASRDMAYCAALQILESQSRLFAMTEPRECMPFNLVFATFDAIVLLATICLLFPDEKLDQRDSALNSIEWGVARLGAMRTSNPMAGYAYNVVQNLCFKVSQPRRPIAQSTSQSAVLSEFPELSELTSQMGDLADVDLLEQPPPPPPLDAFSPSLLAGLLPPQPLHGLFLQTFDVQPHYMQHMDPSPDVLGPDVSQFINEWL